MQRQETTNEAQLDDQRKIFDLSFLSLDTSSPAYMPKAASPLDGTLAMWLVKAARPRQVAALGLGHGYVYLAICQAVAEAELASRCQVFDPFVGSEDTVLQAFGQQHETYDAFSTLLQKTGPEALGDIADGSLDLLLINRHHGHEDVRSTLESWTPKLAARALVLVEGDLVTEADGALWAEVSLRQQTFHFDHRDGLGLVFFGKDMTPELGEFRALAQTGAGRQAISAIFRNAEAAQVLDHAVIELARDAQGGGSGFPALEGWQAEAALPPWANAMAEVLRDARARVRDSQAEVATQRDRMDALLLENMIFRQELAQARGSAYQVWKENLTYRSLVTLSQTSLLPVSKRMRARLAKSAAKRDPKRTLQDIPELSDHLLSAAAQSEAVAKAAHSRGSFITGKLRPDPAMPNVLVVTHEASWSGAPILVHNLARELSARYNVSIICVKKAVGLMPQMLEVSNGVLLLRDFNITGQVTAFLAKSDFKFAVVNSVASRDVLPALKQAGLPVIALMHEFASYTRPATAFAEVMTSADVTVFSSLLTLQSACDVTGLSPNRCVRILPQGKCDVPAATSNPAVREKDRAKLAALLRPEGAEGDFLVLGAGTVEVRKGVDLFIETARQVLASPKGQRARFVWIGGGYDPGKDSAYSVYLQDQLRRSGVEGRVTLLPATPEIEHAYALADAFMLTSRVDPLPNVGIDTMLLGLPILCFDRASGFAEILRQGGMAEDCVGAYLDPADLARRLTGLIADPERHRAVSRRMKEIATEAFDMPRYARQIEDLAHEALSLRQSREADIDTIATSVAFDPDHMMPSKQTVPARAKAAKAYLETFATGRYPRRPEPGFNQHAYAEEHVRTTGKGLGQDAYAAFLRAGRPAGRWLTPVLETSTLVGTGATALRCALHIHTYYVAELPRLLDHLAANQVRPSLFVSVTDEDSRQSALRFLQAYAGPTEVRIVPNIGRDIGPMLTEFGRELVDGFDIIGHVHTKKSEATASHRAVRDWTRLLLENVLGGQAGGAMADRILQAFEADPKLGLVYPSDPNLLGWTRNWSHAQDLAQRLNVQTLPQAFDFPVGTMFWMRAAALRPLVGLGLDWHDFPREPLGADGSLLHALERLFGILPLQYGFRAAVTSIKGIRR